MKQLFLSFHLEDVGNEFLVSIILLDLVFFDSVSMYILIGGFLPLHSRLLTSKDSLLSFHNFLLFVLTILCSFLLLASGESVFAYLVQLQDAIRFP
jgi:hypothetical protein